MKLKPIITLVMLVITIQASFSQKITLTPNRAFDYYNEIGVNTHIDRDTSVYFLQFDNIIYPKLLKLGIKNVRNPLPYNKFVKAADTSIIKNRFIKLHDSLGIKMCFLLTSRLVIDSPLYRDSAIYLSLLENSCALRNATKYIEGYNEPDMNIYNRYPGNWDTIIYKMQKGLWNRIHSGTLSLIPVFAPSFIKYWSVPSRTDEIATIMPHISAYFDYANFHTYDTGKDSSTMFPGSYYDITGVRFDTIRKVKPWTVTEIGYENARLSNLPSDSSYSEYGNHYLSELASAKYYSVLFMEIFGRGAKSIYSYEFIDMNTEDSANFEMNFGLLHTDGSEKPAFTVIKNTIQLFADTGATFSPVPLSFALTGDTAGIKYALYQKFNGDYLLGLWQDRSKGICYDFLTFTDFPSDSQLIQIALPFRYSLANVYQPLNSSMPIYSYSNDSILNLNVPDHLLLVDLNFNLLSVPSNDTYNIYPNPATTLISVNGPINYEIAFYDVVGQRIKSYIEISSPIVTFDISQFSKGVYFVVITKSETGMRVIKKLLKE